MIFHITSKSSWIHAKSQGFYTSPSQGIEGFIHFSTSVQVLGVANFIFTGQKDLVLLAVDPLRLSAPLIFEGVSSAKFPHVYGKLNLDAVVEVFEFESKNEIFESLPEGVHRYPHQQLAELGNYIGAVKDLAQENSTRTCWDADFGRRLGLSRLGLRHMILHPGAQSSLPHAESHEEEFVLVLKGRPHVWLDGNLFEAFELDCIAFPAGSGIGHCLINNTKEDIEYFVVGERTKRGNKCYFPLHPEKAAEDPDFFWNALPQRSLGPNSGKPGDLSALRSRGERPSYFKNVFQVDPYPLFSYTVGGVKDSETFAKTWPLGNSLGMKKLGINFERLAPGARTSWPHCHLKEDEFVFVIQGAPSVWLDGYLQRLNAGDGVSFPSGTGISHTVMNEDSRAAYLLVVGEVPSEPDDDKIFYPLHSARNDDMKNEGFLWEARPVRALGPHLGSPRPELKDPVVLESARLRFRYFSDSDLDNVIAIDSDSEVMKYISGGVPATREESVETLSRVQYLNSKQNGFGVFAAELKSTGEFVGWFCLKPLYGTGENELGYRLLRKFWSQGFATEGAEAIRDMAFSKIGLDQIVAITDPENIKSEKVLKKLGMTLNGLRELPGNQGVKMEVNFWELTRLSWRKLRQN
jgi:uncharacterized cupin superfamily protein/uncharacterized protein (DUF952 family)/RimJ/RimL family protein N-acetyltransferase